MRNRNVGKFLELFDLGRNFSDEELRNAYRDLVQVWHPDKYANNERLKGRAEAKIKEINEAYAALRSEIEAQKRRAAQPQATGGRRDVPVLDFVDNVFHPTDLTEASDVAFAHALRIALAAKARLDIFHVTKRKNGNTVHEFPKIMDTLREWNAIPEDSTQDDLRKLGFFYQKVVGYHDNAVSSILAYLRDHPSDIIVLSAQRRGGVDRLIRKSVAEKVSRSTGGMTLFLKDGHEGFVSRDQGKVHLKNILIPIDVEPDPLISVYAAFKFAQLLECSGCVFTLLYVGEAASMPDISPPSHSDWEWKNMRKKGNVVEMIQEAADETAADLIVMATQGHQGFLDAVRGNTTENVLRGCSYPLLSVPERRIRPR